MKTFMAKHGIIKHDWFIVDAENKVLGRLATEIARRLRGKHKIEYTPNTDTGDYIIVLNAEKILLTGKKRKNKLYFSHTGFIGGLKTTKFEDMISKTPEKVIKIAVKGMLPKGPLGRTMYRKLKVYSGIKHKHIAQQPQLLNI